MPLWCSAVSIALPRTTMSRTSTLVVSPLPTQTGSPLLLTGARLLPNRFIAPLVANPWVCCAAVTSLLKVQNCWRLKTNCLAKVTWALVKTMVLPKTTHAKVFADTAHFSLHWAAAVLVSWATLLPLFRPNKTKSFVHHKAACWWCKVVREQAKQLWRFTALRICCTHIVFRWKTKVCWSLDQTVCSFVTSNACCRHLVKQVLSKSSLPTLCPTCSSAAKNLHMLRV